MKDIKETTNNFLFLQQKPRSPLKRCFHAAAGVWLWSTILVFGFLLFLRAGSFFLDSVEASEVPASVVAEESEAQEKIRVLEGFFDFRTTVYIDGSDSDFKALKDKSGAIEAAYQLGRLDLITLVLAAVALGLAGFSYVSYYAIKKKSRAIAKGYAKKSARDAAAKAVAKELDKEKLQKSVVDYLSTEKGQQLLRSVAEEKIANHDLMEQASRSDDSDFEGLNRT